MFVKITDTADKTRTINPDKVLAITPIHASRPFVVSGKSKTRIEFDDQRLTGRFFGASGSNRGHKGFQWGDEEECKLIGVVFEDVEIACDVVVDGLGTIRTRMPAADVEALLADEK